MWVEKLTSLIRREVPEERALDVSLPASHADEVGHRVVADDQRDGEEEPEQPVEHIGGERVHLAGGARREEEENRRVRRTSSGDRRAEAAGARERPVHVRAARAIRIHALRRLARSAPAPLSLR